MKKINLCLVFGGRSGEYEVSILSAKSVYEALDKDKYNIRLAAINKEGGWVLGERANELLLDTKTQNSISKSKKKYKTTRRDVINHVSTNSIFINENKNKTLNDVDVFFPVMHGTYGEDGSIQGLFEILDVSYVGAGVLGSAVGMDKDIMKRLLKEKNIPSAKYFSIKKDEVNDKTLNNIIKTLKYPLFIKPANLGSSVGVSKAKNKKEIVKGIKNAFKFDTKVLIEECIKGREVECSVLGNNFPIASVPGEVIPTHDFYSYEAKYLDENGAKLEIPAKLDKKTIKKIQELAIKTFKILECSGMARVDFFINERGDILVNEINTIPGFTKISMYPKLWEASGVSYTKLLDKLIELAIERKKEKDRLKRSYDPLSIFTKEAEWEN